MDNDTQVDRTTVRWGDSGPFAVVPRWVYLDAELSDRAVRLYAILAGFAGSPETTTFRGKQELAELLACSKSSAEKAIGELREKGAVSIEPRWAGRSRLPNGYVLHAAPLVAGEGGSPEQSGEGSPEQPGGSRARENGQPREGLEPSDASRPRGAPPLAGDDGAQALVAFFVDESRRRGSEPPGRVKGQVAKLVGEMLSEGIEPDAIRAGVSLLLDRRLHPATLPSVVHEASLPARARTAGLSASAIADLRPEDL